MHEVRYPLLFAGCGDGICMPFRGERCYIRQCPECDPKNLPTPYYYEVNSLGGKYQKEYCFCPPVNSSCSNSVRDSYGCVLIKGINEEAKEPCQCLWTLYDKNYPVNLTYTTISYKTTYREEEKHYCCPENAQIDFDKGINVISGINLKIPGSHCGNLTVQLRKVASEDKYKVNVSRTKWLGGYPVIDCVVDYFSGGVDWDCIGGIYAEAIDTIQDKLNEDPEIKQAVEYTFGTKNVPGYITLKINATYYNPSDLNFKTDDQNNLVSEGYITGSLYNNELVASVNLLNCTCVDAYVPKSCISVDDSQWYAVIIGYLPIKVTCGYCTRVKCSGFSMLGGLLEGMAPGGKRVEIPSLQSGQFQPVGVFRLPSDLVKPNGTCEISYWSIDNYEYPGWSCSWTHAPPEGYLP